MCQCAASVFMKVASIEMKTHLEVWILVQRLERDDVLALICGEKNLDDFGSPGGLLPLLDGDWFVRTFLLGLLLVV